MPADAPFFICPDNVMVIGFEELNPENIRVQFIWERCQDSDPVYKAPETLREGTFTESSLVWNIGVVFDELLNEGRFFRTEGEILDPKCTTLHYSDEYKYVNTTIPEARKLLTKAMLKDPVQRIDLSNLILSISLEIQRMSRC